MKTLTYEQLYINDDSEFVQNVAIIENGYTTGLEQRKYKIID